MGRRVSRNWKFFTIEVVNGGERDAFVAFETLDPSATPVVVEGWTWSSSHGISFRLDEDMDDVVVKELSREEFERLTLGELTGHVMDVARYPKSRGQLSE